MDVVRAAFKREQARAICDHQGREYRLQDERRAAGRADAEGVVAGRDLARLSPPQAAEKIEDAVGLYLNPPTHAVVLCVDEKTQIQALSRMQPLLRCGPGVAGRQTHDTAGIA